jgi:hypothetical protein
MSEKAKLHCGTVKRDVIAVLPQRAGREEIARRIFDAEDGNDILGWDEVLPETRESYFKLADAILSPAVQETSDIAETRNILDPSGALTAVPLAEVAAYALALAQGHGRADERKEWLRKSSPPAPAPEGEWRSIKTDKFNEGGFRFYGLTVKNRAGHSWFEVYYLCPDEGGDLLETSGDIFSTWQYDDFEVWSPAPQPLPAPPRSIVAEP